MKLQTKIPIHSNQPKIDYNSKIVLLGSCFVENLGDRLSYAKFQTLQNSFGILFHPKAIENIIERALLDYSFIEEDIFFKNERWYCFEMHSSINESNKKDFIALINRKLAELKVYLLNSTHIVLTFGTAWVYRFVKSQKLVANCVKIPQKKFKKELLSVSDINSSLSNIISLIKESNPKAFIITTVSPVRHLKDGFIDNNLSKAHLITAIHKVLSSESLLKTLFYFPSYEMMIDELRDYRFYKEDMIHPNNTAVSIIWEAFNKAWISSETVQLQKAILAIQSSLKHKPFNPNSEDHLIFIKDLETKIGLIKKEFPHIKF